MEFIKLNKNDIRTALDLVLKVFQEFEAPYCTKEGAEEYKKFLSSSIIVNRLNNNEMSFWGCKDNGKLVGVIATRGANHVSMLFVDKKYHKHGIARNLIQIVKDTCKSYDDIKKLTVNSSPYAIGFYHKLGFADTDKEQTVDGIVFTPMLCQLN